MNLPVRGDAGQLARFDAANAKFAARNRRGVIAALGNFCRAGY
jgi:hypothetical protein